MKTKRKKEKKPEAHNKKKNILEKSGGDHEKTKAPQKEPLNFSFLKIVWKLKLVTYIFIVFFGKRP